MIGVGSSPDDDDADRVEKEYVDPSSTTREEIRADLEEAGFPGESIDAFDPMLGSVDDVIDGAQSKRQITTREDVERSARSVARSRGRTEALTDAASQELGAPSEAALAGARREMLSLLDEDGETIRTNPDLDPAGGPDGRVVGKVSEVATNNQSRSSGYSASVEPTGRGRGTYLITGPNGDTFPIAEVDL